LTMQVDESTVAGSTVSLGKRIEVFLPGVHHALELHDPLRQELVIESLGGELAAPMPGKIVAVLVQTGDRVEKDVPLLILEAMKMEHTIKAPGSGRVARICYQVGEQVGEGAELIQFEAEP